MKARKCDRCGEFYTDVMRDIVVILPSPNKNITSPYYPEECLDLCPKCIDKLKLWLGKHE